LRFFEEGCGRPGAASSRRGCGARGAGTRAARSSGGAPLSSAAPPPRRRAGRSLVLALARGLAAHRVASLAHLLLRRPRDRLGDRPRGRAAARRAAEDEQAERDEPERADDAGRVEEADDERRAREHPDDPHEARQQADAHRVQADDEEPDRQSERAEAADEAAGDDERFALDVERGRVRVVRPVGEVRRGDVHRRLRRRLADARRGRADGGRDDRETRDDPAGAGGAVEVGQRREREQQRDRGEERARDVAGRVVALVLDDRRGLPRRRDLPVRGVAERVHQREYAVVGLRAAAVREARDDGAGQREGARERGGEPRAGRVLRLPRERVLGRRGACRLVGHRHSGRLGLARPGPRADAAAGRRGRGRSGGQGVEVVVVSVHRPRDPVARREQQVETGRGHAEPGLDAAAPGELRGRGGRHGGRSYG
jgi:hypothetical protein